MDAIRTLSRNQNGREFGRYRLLKRLAFGGMAEVYLAELNGTASFSKLVVVKLVLPQFAEDKEFLELFLDEGHLAARLSHPNIAQTFEMGETDGRLYIAMEYVPGEALHTILRRAKDENKPVPLHFSLHVMLQLLSALEYAHSQKDDSGRPLCIVHRDVSPSNVMVTQEGTAKLVDFGIARAVSQKHKTELGLLKGEPAYMAPEQQTPGQIDCRADIFAAGTILYELSTGDRAFGQDTPLELLKAVQLAQFREPRSIDPKFPKDLQRIILKAMARLPDLRYQTASAFRGELGVFASSVGMFPGQGDFGAYVRELFERQEPRHSSGPQKATHSANGSQRSAASKAQRGQVEQVGTGDIITSTMQPAPELLKQSRRADQGEAKKIRPSYVLNYAVDKILKRPSARWSYAAGWLVILAAWATAVSLGLGGGSSGTAVDSSARPGVSKPPRKETSVATSTDSIAEPSEKGAQGGLWLEPVDVSSPVRAPRKQPRAVAKPEVVPSTGKLRLDCDPPARVIEHGSFLGTTPLEIELPAGEHDLLLQNDSMGMKRTVRLMIVGGELTRHFEKL
jgi:serine/threonine-protein kinase